MFSGHFGMVPTVFFTVYFWKSVLYENFWIYLTISLKFYKIHNVDDSISSKSGLNTHCLGLASFYFFNFFFGLLYDMFPHTKKN
jgi:hypothetical protein